MKYSDLLLDWLKDLGYAKCFYVAGGNIMHLLESARHRFECHPFVHEVATVIAAEYFNVISPDKKAFALVTAGPGLTNAVSGLAGAFLESRFVLVIGGQVKSPDLARGTLRQRGIQEIDGVSIAAPVTVASERMERPISRAELEKFLARGEEGRAGPLFLEICLDAQATPIDEATAASLSAMPAAADHAGGSAGWEDDLAKLLAGAQRPVLLMGGGLDRTAAHAALPALTKLGMPVMTTWNGIDRIWSSHPMYFGRPNTWGQRYSNTILQQADVILALGTRLGLQQTGFNWQEFGPVAKVVHVDIDRAELEKGHPRTALAICDDAARVLGKVVETAKETPPAWLAFCRHVKAVLEPLNENKERADFLSPFAVVRSLSKLAGPDDIVIPCSSGGAFTVMMQAFAQQERQRIITNKGLASMGYGLSGAVGAAMAEPGRRTILVEGDGGFAQNLQELGTVAAYRPNLKIFIFDDGGYASIRMTQRNYFGGDYMGCDTATGLGLPHWEKLFDAYAIPVKRLGPGWENDSAVLAAFNTPGPAGFIVTIDPEQTYLPKIASRIAPNGSMVSNPLHAMSPPLDKPVADDVYRFIPNPYLS